MTPDEALIVNSGSTNRAGYRLRVYANGWTALQQGDVPVRKRVPAALVERFFADLKAAAPLDKGAAQLRNSLKCRSPDEAQRNPGPPAPHSAPEMP